MVTANDLFSRLNAIYDELRDAEELLVDADFSSEDVSYLDGLIAIISRRLEYFKHTLYLLVFKK